MASSTLSPGLPEVDYYAPAHKVEVDGRELDQTSNGDLLSVKVVLDVANLSSFDLSFNNWDDRELKFKYSDTDTLDIGRRVHIEMGYTDRLVSMVRGMVTSLAPSFPQSGSPTIGVGGHDSLFCLKDRKPKAGEKRKFENMADWQIAEEIAHRNGLTPNVTQEGPPHDQVIQKNQDDATFLMERAKRIDFDVFVQTDPETKQDVLNFIKPTDGRDSAPIKTYQFEWGRSLMSFSPKLTLSGQVSKLTVRGWDPNTKQVIEATADRNDLPAVGNGTTGPAAIEKCLGNSGGKEERVVDAPVTSEEEAKKLAVSLLREKAYEFITGSGQVIGLPELRPGTNVELLGLGTRFSGSYYVKKVTHTIGGSGYLTQFEVRKDADGGLAS